MSKKKGPKVVEPPVIVKRSYSVQWKREVSDFDHMKLVTLKALRGWTNAELSNHFEVSQTTIKTYLYGLDYWGKVNTPNIATTLFFLQPSSQGNYRGSLCLL